MSYTNQEVSAVCLDKTSSLFLVEVNQDGICILIHKPTDSGPSNDRCCALTSKHLLNVICADVTEGILSNTSHYGPKYNCTFVWVHPPDVPTV